VLKWKKQRRKFLKRKELKLSAKTIEIDENISDRTAPETIVILGAPGSGKDTQANYLVEALGYQIISTGDLMRILAGHNDEVREMIEKGELISDSIVEDELLSAFILLPEGQPVILDGYPRNVEQAKRIDEILVDNSRKLDKVIYLSVPDADLVDRISKRRICETCGQTQIGGKKCNSCGGELALRDDDKPESVKNRLSVFHKTTEPMIELFRTQEKLVEIDGRPAPEAVRDSIKKAL
jgi:adenylate kinase